MYVLISVVTENLCGYGSRSFVSWSFFIVRDRISKYCRGSSCSSFSASVFFLLSFGAAGGGAVAAFAAFLVAASRAFALRLTALAQLCTLDLHASPHSIHTFALGHHLTTLGVELEILHILSRRCCCSLRLTGVRHDVPTDVVKVGV